MLFLSIGSLSIHNIHQIFFRFFFSARKYGMFVFQSLFCFWSSGNRHQKRVSSSLLLVEPSSTCSQSQLSWIATVLSSTILFQVFPSLARFALCVHLSVCLLRACPSCRSLHHLRASRSQVLHPTPDPCRRL